MQKVAFVQVFTALGAMFIEVMWMRLLVSQARMNAGR
jgi:hypothetical protein